MYVVFKKNEEHVLKVNLIGNKMIITDYISESMTVIGRSVIIYKRCKIKIVILENFLLLVFIILIYFQTITKKPIAIII